MATTELPRPEVAAPATRAHDAEHATAEDHAPDEFTDAEFARAFKLGAVFGLPVIYLVVAAISWLAAPDRPILLLVALWPTLFGGWYFGGVVVLGVLERRRHRRQNPDASGRPVSPPASPRA